MSQLADLVLEEHAGVPEAWLRGYFEPLREVALEADGGAVDVLYWMAV